MDFQYCDNFYQHPNDMRNIALADHRDYEPKTLSELLTKRFDLKNPESAQGPATASKGTFIFSYNSGGTNDTYNVHTDFSESDWTLVVYLSPRPPPFSGTSFWKHNASGLDRIPKDYTLKQIEPYVKDGFDRSLWTQRKIIANRFNRAVLLRPDVFHSNTNVFGTDNRNGRLVQVFDANERE
jgi:hypothetical protein